MLTLGSSTIDRKLSSLWSLWDPGWWSTHHLEIAGHHRQKKLWTLFQQQFSAWFAIPMHNSRSELVTSPPTSSTCPVAGHAVSCQLLQECLCYRAASLPRAAHIQWLLQGRVPRASHSDPCGTMLIAMLASEIPVGSAQPAVGQLHFSLCPVVLPSPPFHRVTPKMVRSRNIPQGALRITSLTKVSRGSTHTQEGLKSEQW